ncbi:MAG TPA: hypothetical protein VF158_15295 [Longimicrobiales bacterium]
MESLIIVTHPEPVALVARPIEHEAVPEGSIGVGYYFHDALIARSVVTPESMQAIHSILSTPVSVALAATVDEQGNIDGRVCLVLPVGAGRPDPDVEDEPWKASVPAPPPEVERGYAEDGDGTPPRFVLLPIGNVIRHARDRTHPDDPAGDAREMLQNLLNGRAQDAVAKAIDDLLRSI